MTVKDEIAQLQAELAALPYSGEVLAHKWQRLADLQRQRAELAEKEAAHWKLGYQQMSDVAGDFAKETATLLTQAKVMAAALSELVAAVSVVHGQKQDAERFLDARAAAQQALDALHPQDPA